AIDPIDHLLVAIGTGHVEAFSLSGSTIGEVTLPNVSGDVSAQNGNAPGFVWDSAANVFVAWNGGTNLYTLDPHSWQWTAHQESGGAVPTGPAETGTFGRFQYDAADNVFLVVNDINQDVYMIRPDFGPSTGSTGGSGTGITGVGSAGGSGSGSTGGGTVNSPAPPPTRTGGSGWSSTPTASDFGRGPDPLAVPISGDQDHGLPQFTLSVDGKQVGGVEAVAVQGTGVSHGTGPFEDITFHGNFAGAHTVDINAVD